MMKWFKIYFSKRSPQVSHTAIEPIVSDLMQKNQIRIGKMLLLAGLGLAVLVILEMRQDRVTALVPDIDQEKVPRPEMVRPGNSAQQLATTKQRQSIAVNTDAAATDAQAEVSQLPEQQLAANVWSGSSFPVENFQEYTSPFGYRSSATGADSSEFHYGLDMAAPQGSYIRSWWTGTVVEVTDNSNCGTSVVVESGHWLHIYCHMQGHVETSNDGKRYMVDRDGGLQILEGQEVGAGDRIGRIGMTGRTTGPHLHWGLKYDNNWVNPALVLRAMYAGQQAAAQAQR
jgi:murein DD-endopeptidase MepM/ murein hydrolase activator NlpD